MAIQFPNFLAAQTQKPDYSGIGDSIENFYKGYNMPKDALIKEIQAKFAQPNAEADLKNTQLRNAYQSILNQYAPSEKKQSLETGRLTNKKSQMDIDKLATELAEQQEFERQLRLAFSGGNPQGSPGSPSMTPSPAQPAGMPPLMPNANQGMPPLPGMPKGLPMPPQTPGMTMAGSPPGAPPSYTTDLQDIGTDPSKMDAKYRKFDQMGNAPIAPMPQAIAPNAPAPQMAAPSAVPPPEPLNEVVVAKGQPQLAGIDAMYENNPLSRAFLEKKGYKKTQEIKFDNKTGKTTIITTYPSGKVTVQASSGGGTTGDGMPLTNKMVSKHQGIIAAVDNAVPIIEEILKKPTTFTGKVQQYPRSSGLLPGMGWLPGFGSESTKYEALVSSALDSLVGAYGLPSTNEGIETVKKQLLIGHNETDAAYKRRLRDLVKDLRRRQSYSATEVKKSNKIQPIDTSAGGADDYSDLHNYDVGGE